MIEPVLPSSNPSAAVSITTPLIPPADLDATVSHSDQIDLAWTDLSGGTAGTSVYRSTNGTTFTKIADVTPGLMHYSATGLSPDGHYTFKIASNYAGVESVDAATVAATAISANLTLGGGVTVNEGGRYTLTLASSPTDALSWPIDHWRVDWQDGSGVETVSASAGASGAHTFPGGTFNDDIQVTAVDTHGNTFVQPVKTVNVVPNAPTNLVASPFSVNQINIDWTDNSQCESGFAILRSTDGGVTYSVIGYASENATTFADRQITTSSACVYKAQARNDDGGNGGDGGSDGGVSGGSSSSSSNTSSVTAPTGKVSLSHSNDPFSGAAILTWIYDGLDAHKCELEMKHDGFEENFYLFDVGPAHVTADGKKMTGSFTLGVLDPDDPYDFRARADRDDQTVSDYSNVETGHLQSKMIAPPMSVNQTTGDATFDPSNFDHTQWQFAGFLPEYKVGDFGPDWHIIDHFPEHELTSYPTFGPSGNIPRFSSLDFRVTAVYDSILTNARAYSHFASTSFSQPFDVAPPTGLSATLNSDGTVTATYDVRDGYRTFLYEIPRNGTFPVEAFVGSDDGNGHVTFGCSSDYLFGRRQEIDTGKWSGYAGGKAQGTIPTAPGDLDAIRIKGGKAEIHWHNNSNNETGFVLERSLYADFHNPTDITVGTDDTKYIDGDIDGKHSYHYRVKAKDAAGDSAWSNEGYIGHILVVLIAGHFDNDPNDPPMPGSDSYTYKVQAELLKRNIASDEIFITSEDGPNHRMALVRLKQELKARIAMSNAQGEPLKIAMVGYSHGGSVLLEASRFMIADVNEDNHPDIGEYVLYYTAYIDAIERNLDGPIGLFSAPQRTRPVGTLFHMNWFQSKPDNDLQNGPLHGDHVAGEDGWFDYDYYRNVKTHTNIDDEPFIHESLADNIVRRQ